MGTSPKIYVAGHRGMVAFAIVRQLLPQGHPAGFLGSQLCDKMVVLGWEPKLKLVVGIKETITYFKSIVS